MPRLLDLAGHNEGLFALSAEERRHCLKLFVLLFGRQAFLAEGTGGQTLHQRALAESRLHEERVAQNIAKLVFEKVFPGLVTALAEAAPHAPLSEVREAALILLYRLLFLLYAEDRALLPVGDPVYQNIGLRDRVRLEVGRRKDGGETFSSIATSYYAAIEDLSRTIDQGDPAFGLPPYNGGLFDESRTPLLGQVRLSNRVMADVIDALSFERPEGRKGRYINYRSLSVQQLGSIYERLLEFEPVREGGTITVRPNLFARRGSGSYYTPEPLVTLILDETVGPLVDRKLETFRTAVAASAAQTPTPETLQALTRVDPAEALLGLKVCDPAMGSGHFLVSLVDFLSDRVIAALEEAEDTVPGYVSPLTHRIEGIRNTILGNAGQKQWTVDPEHLDDRQIVRRLVLKRCVYGVDKNPMAVELAKVSLWLDTSTVGAPLSFLDHHLHCGDSLFGSWVREGLERARAQGGELFLAGPLARARAAADPMQTHRGAVGRRSCGDGPILQPLRRHLGWHPTAGCVPVAPACLRLAAPGRAGQDCDRHLAAWQPRSSGPHRGRRGGRRRAQRRSAYLRRTAHERPSAHRRRTLPQLAGRLSRCLGGLGVGGTRRRIRRGDRQSALGPHQAAAGGVVQCAAPEDRAGAARLGPQADDPGAGGALGPGTVRGSRPIRSGSVWHRGPRVHH